MTICAIHQPNFFPWLGYFDKINQADIFIFLDAVDYPKSGSGLGSWCNRVKILNHGKLSWLGLPVQRQPGAQLIKNVEFTNKAYHLSKVNKTLEHAYKKAPYYRETWSLIQDCFNYDSNNLADFNIHLIKTISKFLGFHTIFVKQSELDYKNQSTQLLIDLVKQVGGNAYLSGNGAAGYQDDVFFKKEGINLIYQNQAPASLYVEGLVEAEQALSILHILFRYYGVFSAAPVL